jgi:hypothetical protein
VKATFWILMIGLALACAPLAADENLVQWHRIGAGSAHDMVGDDVDMGMSATVGQCITGWTGTDPPIEPAAAAGFWYAIWTTGAQVYVGWNWPSIPIHPMYDVEVGEGYVIWFLAWRQEPCSVSGYVAYPDYEIPLPARGWSWIGYPRMLDMLEANLLVRDDVSGFMRTCWEDFHAPNPWLNWNMLYWDPLARTTRILSPFGGGDDDAMHEWLGYRVWTNTEDLSLIVPAS